MGKFNNMFSELKDILVLMALKIYNEPENSVMRILSDINAKFSGIYDV